MIVAMSPIMAHIKVTPTVTYCLLTKILRFSARSVRMHPISSSLWPALIFLSVSRGKRQIEERREKDHQG